MKNRISLLKKIACALMLSLLLPVSANADIINILNLQPEGTVSGTGDLAGFTVTSTTSALGNTVTYSFTQTGDLDSGTANDTLSFDLIYEAYTGSTFDGTDVTLGTTAISPNVGNINWHSNSFTTGDTISLEVANISYTDGEGDDTAVFNGFTSFRSVSFNGAPAGDIDYYVGLAGATTVTGDPTFTPNFTTSNGTSPTLFFTAASGPVRLRDLDFQFETVPVAIPEPSTLALVAAGLGMIGLRRRRLK